MFSHRYPKFSKGRILKKEMLENLRDYPRNFTDLWLNDYSNGIISGANVLVQENYLTITRGMVKHAGKIYSLETDYRLPYRYSDQEALLKIRFREETSDNDFISCGTEIYIDQDNRVQEDEFELGRFKLKEGAKLRSEYQGFFDLSTEYNTFNIIHVEYAGFRQSTISPIILRYFAEEILKSKSTDPYDIAFTMQCLNQSPVDRELILYYLANRLQTGYREYTNVQIHKHLVRLVDEARRGTGKKADFRSGPQRVIVD